MAIFRRKQKKDKASKEEYLRLFKGLFKAKIYKGDKSVPTYAQWKRRKPTGSSGTKRQLKRLSSGDYKELQKFK